jgi:hypothetical protein
LLERFLDRVVELIDDTGPLIIGDHRPGITGYLGVHTLDQIGCLRWSASKGRRGARKI